MRIHPTIPAARCVNPVCADFDLWFAIIRKASGSADQGQKKQQPRKASHA